jgi:hypothetical protein
MSREPVTVSTSREGFDRALNSVEEIRRKIQRRLELRYNQVNQNGVFDGGGFFCKRDNAAVEAVFQSMREAFYAGFKRSDIPPPSEDRIEAAFREWMERH